MEMSEKQKKKYNEKFQKEQETKDKNSEEVISIIRSQPRLWSKKAIDSVKKGINPWYRDPKTEQSLLEVALEYNGKKIRQPLINVLRGAGAPFYGEDDRDIDHNESSTYSGKYNLLVVGIDKYCKKVSKASGYGDNPILENLTTVPDSGKAFLFKESMYDIVASRIKQVDSYIRIQPLVGLKHAAAKAAFPGKMSKYILADIGKQAQNTTINFDGPVCPLFDDFCQALDQVNRVILKRDRIDKEHQLEKHFVQGFLNKGKWRTDYVAFYRDPSNKATTIRNNIFKKFLFRESKKNKKKIE